MLALRTQVRCLRVVVVVVVGRERYLHLLFLHNHLLIGQLSHHYRVIELMVISQLLVLFHQPEVNLFLAVCLEVVNFLHVLVILLHKVCRRNYLHHRLVLLLHHRLVLMY
jgi:hypothetical protein